MAEATCGICMEPDDDGRYITSCYTCGLDTCNECIINYFETTPGVDRVGCMGYQCSSEPWDLGQMRRLFRVEDFQRLHKFHVDNLLQREKEFMEITYSKWILETLRERIDELKREIVQLATIIRRMGPGELEEHGDILERIEDLTVETQRTRERYNAHKESMDATIIGVCATQDCPGYITDKSDVCLMCNLVTCTDCAKCKDDSHVCNPDDVASVTEIRKNTRNCPGCNARILKSEGCDQMYCVRCKTAFDWSTGKVLDVRRIHNPELIAELNNPEDPNFGCFLRGDITSDDFRYFPQNTYVNLQMSNIIHMERILNNNQVLPYGPDTNEKLRRRILERGKSLDDVGVARQFNRVVRAWSLVHERDSTYNELFSSFTRVVKDLLINLQRRVQDGGRVRPKMINEFRDGVEGMREYFIEELAKLDEYYDRPGEGYIQDLSNALTHGSDILIKAGLRIL